MKTITKLCHHCGNPSEHVFCSYQCEVVHLFHPWTLTCNESNKLMAKLKEKSRFKQIIFEEWDHIL